MFSFNEIEIQNIIVHHIGSKNDEEGIQLSNNCIDLADEQLQLLLMQYFLTPFKPGEMFHLSHPDNISQNEVYQCVKQMFAEPDGFIEQSVNIANHLYEQSGHPKIKTGELYVAYFTNCIVDGETVEAIGLFKSESKDTFLKVQSKKGTLTIGYDTGININKLDKGCIIFNTEQDKGYLVTLVDTVNKNAEAQYWRNNFLQVKPRKDEYHQTRNYLDMCKTFVVDHAPKEFEISKADQADFLNKSSDYFKKNEEFVFDEFTDQVIRQPEVVDSFKQYKKQYETENACEINDSFTISGPAVRKESKVFRSVIKLDRNFHIYVHGNRENIIRGYDEKTGMHFYQLFFKEEK